MRYDPIYEAEYKGMTLKIHPDEYVEDPRKDMDFAATFVFENQKHCLSDDDDYAGDEGVLHEILFNVDRVLADRLFEIVKRKDRKIFTYDYCYKNSGTREYREQQESFDAWSEDLYARYLDKLGVVYTDFSLKGQEHHRGVAYIAPGKIQKEWKGDKDMALRCIESEINVLNQWIEGDIYYYALEDEDENWVDSCGGIYGYDEAIRYAEEQADYWAKNREEEKEDALLV